MQATIRERIKRLREKKKLTMERLAQKAGCTKSYISQLENGKNIPSLSMLDRLAKALDVQVVDLFNKNTKNVQLDGHLRKDERRTINYPDGKVVSQLLTKGIFQKRMQPLITIIKPGGASDFKTELSHPPGSEEFVLVLKGEVDFWFGSEKVSIKEGDTLYFKGDLPHGWANNGKETAEVLFVWTPPIW